LGGGELSQALYDSQPSILLKLSVKLAAAVGTGLSTLAAFKLTDPNGFELPVDLRKVQDSSSPTT